MKDELFKEALRLLQDLADIQNGPPRVQDDGEWNKLINQVYDFLNEHESGLD